MSIVYWNPLRGVRSTHRSLDQVFGGIAEFNESSLGSSYSFPLDVYDGKDAFIIRAALPGVNADEIDVSFKDDAVIIKGNLEMEKNDNEDGSYYRRELRHGDFCREVPIDLAVDPEKAEAELVNGLLTVTLPKSRDAFPRKIEIKAS